MTNEKLIQTAKEAMRNDTVLQRGIVDLLCQALEASDAQVKQLAAENYNLKHPGTYLPSKCDTPATDAILASLRAEGVEMALTGLLSYLNHGVDIDSMETKWDVSSAVVEYINSKLRSKSEVQHD